MPEMQHFGSVANIRKTVIWTRSADSNSPPLSSGKGDLCCYFFLETRRDSDACPGSLVRPEAAKRTAMSEARPKSTRSTTKRLSFRFAVGAALHEDYRRTDNSGRFRRVAGVACHQAEPCPVRPDITGSPMRRARLFRATIMDRTVSRVVSLSIGVETAPDGRNAPWPGGRPRHDLVGLSGDRQLRPKCKGSPRAGRFGGAARHLEVPAAPRPRD